MLLNQDIETNTFSRDRLNNVIINVDIVKLISEFIHLKPYIRTIYIGGCPFDELNKGDHPLFVAIEKKVWYCPECGCGGIGIYFYQKIKQLPFQQAVKDIEVKYFYN